jgi:hypothetical protein
MKAFSNRIFFSTLAITAAMAANCARAGDQFWIFDGPEARTQTSPVQTTSQYGFEFMKDLSDHFAVSIGYGNEGHFNQGPEEHHRDYDGANLWAKTNVFNNQLTLAAGVGPILYYDTTGGPYGHSTEDLHGFGASYSLTATLNTFSPLLLQVRTNFIDAGSFNTKSLMLGIGYNFDGKESTPSFAPGDQYGETRNEVTFFAGKSVINLSGDGHANDFGVEYRRDLGDHLQWTAGFLDEGKSTLADRRGLTSELWLTQSMFNNRLSIGAAGGLYLAHDSVRPDDNTFVTPMGSVTVAYQLTSHITARLTWDRIITLGNYNRDADVGKFGIGYRF